VKGNAAAGAAGRRLQGALEALLADRTFYSYETVGVAQTLAITRPQLLDVAAASGDRSGDAVNVFTFGGVEYLGLESRRVDYEEDKAAGTNHVEDKIKSGWYARAGAEAGGGDAGGGGTGTDDGAAAAVAPVATVALDVVEAVEVAKDAAAAAKAAEAPTGVVMEVRSTRYGWEHVLDASVYETHRALRMLGSRKAQRGEDVGRVYGLLGVVGGGGGELLVGGFTDGARGRHGRDPAVRLLRDVSIRAPPPPPRRRGRS
jgi:hypothetical protein